MQDNSIEQSTSIKNCKTCNFCRCGANEAGVHESCAGADRNIWDLITNQFAHKSALSAVGEGAVRPSSFLRAPLRRQSRHPETAATGWGPSQRIGGQNAP